MGNFGQDHGARGHYHEPLDKKGDITSVGPSALFVQAHHYVLCSAAIHGFTNSDHQRINTMYDQFGPTPRICYDFIKHNPSLMEHEARSQAALGRLSLRALRQMISNEEGSNPSSESQMLFLMKRVPEKRLREADLSVEVDHITKYAYASVEPITHAAEVAIRDQLWQEDQINQFKFYCSLASEEGTRQISSLVFKWIGHSQLRERIKLDLFPVTKIGRAHV